MKQKKRLLAALLAAMLMAPSAMSLLPVAQAVESDESDAEQITVQDEQTASEEQDEGLDLFANDDDSLVLSLDEGQEYSEGQEQTGDEAASIDDAEAVTEEVSNQDVENEDQEFLEETVVEETVREAPMNSLLNLQEYDAYLSLTQYSRAALEEFSVVDMLNQLRDSNGQAFQIDANATTVWKYTKNNEDNIEQYEAYQINPETTIDLYPGDNVSAFQFELVVGRDGQLNSENKRYIVKATILDDYEIDLQPEIYVEGEDGSRQVMTPESCNSWTGILHSNGEPFEERYYDLAYARNLGESLASKGKVYVAFKSELANNPRIRIEFYKVFMIGNAYVTVNYPITSSILNQNMEQSGTGYPISGEINTDETFFVRVYVDDVQYSETYVCLRYWAWYPVHEGTLYTWEDGKKTEVTEKLDSTFEFGSDVTTITFTLKPQYTTTQDYYFDYDLIRRKNYGSGNDENVDYPYVTKVVLGHYNTEEEAEAAGAIDVSNDIVCGGRFPNGKGYLADYSGEGVKFTIFKVAEMSSTFPLPNDKLADKITVKVVESQQKMREFTEDPIIGEADPWFRVTGATDSDGQPLDTYIIENGKTINIDTMYGSGYQTVFMNSNVDSFIPTFWRVDEEAITVDKIFVNGKPFNVGDSIHFPDGENTVNARFAVIITDSTAPHPKNYDVTFIKRASGPKLYVAGPLKPIVRAVFLDQQHENKHDIFIANIGDEPLQNLWVDLNATNVRLDDYWTIGGEGNNSLAACPSNFSQEMASTRYGELPNVGKIRLIPPKEGKGGKIEGELNIYCGERGNPGNSTLLATILLSEAAQKPEINTVRLDPDTVVQYVPYSFLITTDNMYNWNTVSFSHSGEIPDGMDFNDATGELYGAPTKPGTYTFKVTANSSVSYFSPSSKEFTITVLENEDERVFKTSDVSAEFDYSIIPNEDGDVGYVGEQVSAYRFELTDVDQDDIYISNGTFNQFVKLWINGIELQEGVHYEKNEGSTRITVKSQTLKNRDIVREGRNTISAEFNINGERGEHLKRTSQNFYLNTVKPTDPEKPTEAPTQAPTEKPTQAPTEAPTQAPTQKPTQVPTEAPTQKPTQAPTEAPTEKPTQAPTDAPAQEPTRATEQPDGNDAEPRDNTPQSNNPVANSIGITFNVVDVNGGPLAGKTLELHSKVQIKTTSAAGQASFGSVEFGNHTLYVKNADGSDIAHAQFELISGNTLSHDGRKITVQPGRAITMTIQIDGSNATITSVVDNGGEVRTGDHNNLPIWTTIFVADLTVLVVLAVIELRKKLK